MATTSQLIWSICLLVLLVGSAVGQENTTCSIAHPEGCSRLNVSTSVIERRAMVILKGDGVSGNATFTQHEEDGPVTIRGTISGLTKGKYGFHIYEKGDLTTGCKSTKSHGDPTDVGDLGNIFAEDNGVADITIVVEKISLEGRTSIVGRSMVVHPDADDLGRGGFSDSLTTGVACGVIVIQYFQTLFHLIKCHIKSGLFAVGDVFRNHNSGLLLGPLLTLCLAIVCICDNHILASCSKEVKTRNQLHHFPSFPDTLESAFKSGPSVFQRCSRTARQVVTCLSLTTQLGCCIVYFIFISTSLQSLIQMLSRHGIEMDQHLVIVIIFFPAVFTVFMSNLQFLTLFTVLASVFVFSAVSLTLYVSASDLPPATPRPAIAHWSQIPLFFGTSIYCFEGIVKKFPGDEDKVKADSPMKQCSLLIGLLTLVGLLFIVIAFICFIKFVDDLASSHTSLTDHAIFNLSKHYLCSEAVQLTVALGLLFSYTLQFHIALSLVWPELAGTRAHAQHPILSQLAVRLLLATATFAAVEIAPPVGLFISLSGAVCGALSALLLPPLCDLALHWNDQSRPFKHLFDFISIFLAIIGFVMGMSYTMMVMVKGLPDEITSSTT